MYLLRSENIHFTKQSIKSEIHFLIECPLYDDLGYDVFNHIEQSDPDFKNSPSLCKYACSMTDQSLQKQLINMCCHMFSRRKKFYI